MRRCCLCFAVGLLASPVGLAEAASWGETYTLDNGLRVVLTPDHRFPSVTVLVRYHVGARQEPPGRVSSGNGGGGPGEPSRWRSRTCRS